MTYVLTRVIPYGLLIGSLSFGSLSCSQSAGTEAPTSQPTQELTILWDKGYVLEEDEAIEATVSAWQASAEKPVRLSFYNSGEIAPKTLRASKAGLSPDILFAAKSVYPVSDWQGKLADVTDVVATEASGFTADALQAAKVYGVDEATDAAGDRYYAVPLNQSIIPIHYWKDLLAQAGYTPEDIPQEWDAFWNFWKTAQTALQEQGQDIYGVGLPYSRAAKDSYQLFEQVLIAYDVQLLDSAGQLQTHRPEVREGIIRCLRWYTEFYGEGYVPPRATTWADPDNNRSFLNRQVLMTPNPTLSIPAAVRNDETVYFEQMGTLPWPTAPNGQPLPHLLETRQAVIFADASHMAEAKDFLRYLIQPAVINEFLKTSYGRFFPPGQALRSDPFWRNPEDPHISTVTNIVLAGQTQPFNNSLNPAYGVVLEENVWGAVLQAIVEENLSPEAAADRAIAQIEQIFANWSS